MGIKEVNGRYMLTPSIWDRIKHIFGTHKYGYVARLSTDSHMVACTICKKRFAMNTSVKCLVEWDQELEDMYYRFDLLENKAKESLAKVDEIKKKYKREKFGEDCIP